MVGTGNVVTHALGRPAAQEHRTCVLDLAQKLPRLAHRDLQMLGSDGIDYIKRLLQALAGNDQTMVQRIARNLRARGLLDQLVDSRLDVGHHLGDGGNQIAGSLGVMLGLGHEVYCHELGDGVLVCKHADLAGAGDHIDAAIAAHELLCRRHKGVAGAGDLVDCGNGGRAVGHGTDGLGTTGFENAVHARHACSSQGVGVDLAVFLRRRAHDDLSHAGHARGDGVHEHRGGVLGTATGHVDAHAVERGDLLTSDGAIGARVKPALLHLALVEIRDVIGRVLDRPQELLVDHLEGLVDLFLRDLQLV